jgi:ABC-type multidrug transport system ATPase subunit
MLQDTSTSLLAVCGLAKAYDGRVIVAGLDLVVEAGSAVALMRPNDCGKSTVLRSASSSSQLRTKAAPHRWWALPLGGR